MSWLTWWVLIRAALAGGIVLATLQSTDKGLAMLRERWYYPPCRRAIIPAARAAQRMLDDHKLKTIITFGEGNYYASDKDTIELVDDADTPLAIATAIHEAGHAIMARSATYHPQWWDMMTRLDRFTIHRTHPMLWAVASITLVAIPVTAAQMLVVVNLGPVWYPMAFLSWPLYMWWSRPAGEWQASIVGLRYVQVNYPSLTEYLPSMRRHLLYCAATYTPRAIALTVFLIYNLIVLIATVLTPRRTDGHLRGVRPSV